MVGMHSELEKHWTVDRTAASVTHESGFSAQFITLPLPASVAGTLPEASPLCQCCAEDGRSWWLVMTPELFRSTSAELIARHGPQAAQEMLAHLSREACDFWVELKKLEH